MGRLRPEALYRNELVDEHRIRDQRYDHNPCDTTDYDAVWERAAERIKIIDPTGAKSYALLRKMQLESTAEEISDKVDS